MRPARRGADPAEGCLDAPTVACIKAHFAEGADLPLRAVPSVERPWPANALRRALLALGEADEVERISRRAARGTEPPKGDVNVAVVRFLASVRAGAPNLGLLDGEDIAHSAHWLAGQALLRELAADAGVAEAQDAPPEKRAALRDSPAWRGLTESYARWNESVDEKRRQSVWTELARLHLGAGDFDAARAALARIGPLPAELGEVSIWFRLGDRARAEARARASGGASTVEAYLYLAAQEALSRRASESALVALEEEWALKASPRGGRGSPDFRSLRGLVRRTADAGDHALAVSRAEAMRGLPTDAGQQPETHWVDAAGALNDIGEHDAAARLLRELLAQRPADLAAVEAGAALPKQQVFRRGDYLPYVGLVAELYRAGMEGEAERMLRATVARDAKPSPRPVQPEDIEAFYAKSGLPMRPGVAERAVQELRLAARAHFFPGGQVPGTLEWRDVLARDAASPERVAGLLRLASGVSDGLRALVLVDAALGDARHGRNEAAAERLAEATSVAASLDLPYNALCRTMWQAAKLGRVDLADAAFRAGVAAAPAEPQELRPTALLHLAACRAVPHH